MKLVDLNQTIFVPVVDETKDGMTVEMKMTVGEFFRKFCQGFEPNVVDAVPVVHGRWVDEKGNPVPWCDALPSSPAYSCWCNQCGTWLVASDEYPVYGLFCPACGAKMTANGGRANDTE